MPVWNIAPHLLATQQSQHSHETCSNHQNRAIINKSYHHHEEEKRKYKPNNLRQLKNIDVTASKPIPLMDITFSPSTVADIKAALLAKKTRKPPYEHKPVPTVVSHGFGNAPKHLMEIRFSPIEESMIKSSLRANRKYNPKFYCKPKRKTKSPTKSSCSELDTAIQRSRKSSTLPIEFPDISSVTKNPQHPYIVNHQSYQIFFP